MIRYLVVLIFASLFMALPAFANTPAEENGAVTIVNDAPGDRNGVIFSTLLCSDAAAGDTNCTAFDMKNAQAQGATTVSFFIFDDGKGVSCTNGRCTQQIAGTDSCTLEATVALHTGPFATTNTPTVGGHRVVASTNTIDTTSASTRVLTLNLQDTPLDRYIFTTLTNMTACDDVDVMMTFYRF